MSSLPAYPPFNIDPASGDLKVNDGKATDIHGNARVASTIEVGGGFRYITHDYCDSTTWWQESSEHTDQATTTTDDLTFDITGHQRVIDVRHSKLTFEDDITVATVAPNGNTMTNIIPVVKVNDVAVDQSNEDASSGDDRYTVDYTNGAVTFAVARADTDTVKVSFRKAGSSAWTLVPDADKRLILEDAEIDVSEDIDFNNSYVTTTVYGSHSVLTGGAIVPLQVRRYKSFHDFQAAARKFWGPIPANFGGTGSVPSPKWTFQWEYSRSDELYNAANYVDQNLDATKPTLNKLVVTVNGDTELGGSVITMAFYGQELPEAD